MKHEKAIARYMDAKLAVRRLEAADPADMPDHEYLLKQAKGKVQEAIRSLTGGDLATANRMLATPAPREG